MKEWKNKRTRGSEKERKRANGREEGNWSHGWVIKIKRKKDEKNIIGTSRMNKKRRNSVLGFIGSNPIFL